MRKPALCSIPLPRGLTALAAVLAVALGARMLGASAGESTPVVIVHSSPIYPATESRSLHSTRFIAPPIIDGNLSDWPAADSIDLNRNTAYSFSGRIDSLDDLSAVIRSGWDEQKLYFAFQVTDDVVIGNDSSDVWRDDSVEIGIDGLHDQYPWGWDDHQFTIVVDGRKTDRGAPATDVVARALAVTGGYNIEVAIPVAKLIPGVPISGTVMGFTIGIHDDDDGGNWDAYLIWEGTNTSSTPELFGTLLFSERPEDRLIALEARIIKLERQLQELLAILKEFELVNPPQ